VSPATYLGADERIEALCPVCVVNEVDDLSGVDAVEEVESGVFDCGRSRQRFQHRIGGSVVSKGAPVGVPARDREEQLLVASGDFPRDVPAGSGDPELREYLGFG
jgi:hypothetical protein